MISPSSPDLATSSGDAAPSLHHAHHLVDAGAARGAGLVRRVLVDGEGVDFRRAVVIDEQLRLERRRKLLQQPVGHRRAGEADLAHRRDVGLPEALVMHQIVIERRHQIEIADPLLLDQFQRARHLEARQAHERAADERHRQAASAPPWCDRAASRRACARPSGRGSAPHGRALRHVPRAAAAARPWVLPWCPTYRASPTRPRHPRAAAPRRRPRPPASRRWCRRRARPRFPRRFLASRLPPSKPSRRPPTPPHRPAPSPRHSPGNSPVRPRWSASSAA